MEHKRVLVTVTVATCATLALGCIQFLHAQEPERQPVYRFPIGEENGLRYLVSYLNVDDELRPDLESVSSIQFLVTVWGEEDGDTVRLRVPSLIHNGVNIAQLLGGRWEEGRVREHVFEFTLSSDGAISFDQVRYHDQGEALVTWVQRLGNFVLPVLFVPLPPDFEPRVGFTWGPESTDTPTRFESHPEITQWIVREQVREFGRSVWAIHGYAKSNKMPTSGLPYEAYADQRHLIHYDEASGVVRAASLVHRVYSPVDEETGGPQELRFDSWTIEQFPSR